MTRLFPTAIHRRLAPLLAAFLFGGVALWVPVEKLFLTDIGFTPQTIGLMAAAYAATVPLLEIPSGILADRWSRRGVLVVGNAGAVGAVLLGGLSTNVPTYIAAAVLLGVYFAMRSGTFDAIVYDTVLEETGSSDQFESMVGRIRVAESAALVSGALAGGGLAALTAPRVTYFATLPFLGLSTACLLAFREPQLHATGDGRSLRRHVAVTLGTFRRQPGLVPVATLSILTAVLTQAVFEFGPLWLVDAQAGAGAYGPAWAVLMASYGAGGLVAARVSLERPAVIAGVALASAVAAALLMSARSAAVVTGAQFVLATVGVAVGVFATKRLHDAVPSDIRAGLASAVGAATWTAFLPLSLVLGVISERFSMRAAGWVFAGVVVAVTALLAVVVAGRPRLQRPVHAVGGRSLPVPTAAPQP